MHFSQRFHIGTWYAAPKQRDKELHQKVHSVRVVSSETGNPRLSRCGSGSRTTARCSAGRFVPRPQPSALAALRKSVDPLPPLHAVLVIVSRVPPRLHHLRIGGTATRTGLGGAVLARKDDAGENRQVDFPSAFLERSVISRYLVSGPAAVHSLHGEWEGPD